MAEYTRQNIPSHFIPENMREKWPLGILKEGYVPFPKAFVRTLGKILGGPDAICQLAVLLALIDQKRPRVRTNPTIEYLAFLTDLAIPETRKALNALRDQGLIQYTEGSEQINATLTGLYEAVEKHAFPNESPTPEPNPLV